MITVCKTCGSGDVEYACWVDARTNEPGELFGSWDEMDTKWCNNCGSNELLEEREEEMGDMPFVKYQCGCIGTRPFVGKTKHDNQESTLSIVIAPCDVDRYDGVYTMYIRRMSANEFTELTMDEIYKVAENCGRLIHRGYAMGELAHNMSIFSREIE